MKTSGLRTAVLALAMMVCALGSGAMEETTATLPAPKMTGGMPLLNALHERQSAKGAYSAKPVTTETLSGLLWAAYGVNRPASGGRTVPSGLKSYEIDVYVITAHGAYRYAPFAHALARVAGGDLRALAGGKGNLKDAPIELVYVSDAARQGKVAAEKRAVYSAVHTGFIGQNVYLYCASEGLGTVFREGADKTALKEKLNLRKEQEVIFAQTVGYPK